jgi:hypothetical protein
MEKSKKSKLIPILGTGLAATLFSLIGFRLFEFSIFSGLFSIDEVNLNINMGGSETKPETTLYRPNQDNPLIYRNMSSQARADKPVKIKNPTTLVSESPCYWQNGICPKKSTWHWQPKVQWTIAKLPRLLSPKLRLSSPIEPSFTIIMMRITIATSTAYRRRLAVFSVFSHTLILFIVSGIRDEFMVPTRWCLN